MLELKVGSISEEAELRIASLLKGLGVEQGLLDAFWVEDELLTDESPLANDMRAKSVAPALVAPYAQPRATATALFADHTTELDASEVSRLLASKEDWMLSMDRTFGIEIAFLSGMVGAGGEEVAWCPIPCARLCVLPLASYLGEHRYLASDLGEHRFWHLRRLPALPMRVGLLVGCMLPELHAHLRSRL